MSPFIAWPTRRDGASQQHHAGADIVTWPQPCPMIANRSLLKAKTMVDANNGLWITRLVENHAYPGGCGALTCSLQQFARTSDRMWSGGVVYVKTWDAHNGRYCTRWLCTRRQALVGPRPTACTRPSRDCGGPAGVGWELVGHRNNDETTSRYRTRKLVPSPLTCYRK